MTINERVSDEELVQVYATAREARLPVVWTEKKAQAHFRDKITPEVVESIARELEQCRAAEPVYQAKFSLGWRDVTKVQYDDHVAHGSPVRIVYAAPQVTGVPEEVPESLKDRLLTICDLVEDNDEYCQDIWNACRAAMLGDGTLTNEGTTAAPAVQAEQLSGNTEQVSQP
ncbi:hypothetical protein FD682_22420, partial [Atlantibacter subterranea]|nr:hypothetical protein [Atlantibacter subterranea]